MVGLKPQKQEHLLFAGGWLLLMLALNFTWFARQVKNFQPLRRTEAVPATMDAPPIIPAAAS